MNILIVSQYFWPENFIINDLVLKIKAQGHNISVYTGKPNYPDGVIYPGYVSAGVQQEFYHDGVDVYRIPLRPRKSGGRKNIALNYLSFIYSGIKHAFNFSKDKKFDVVFVFAPSPITSVIPAILIKWLTRGHLAVWVQDLWPESIKATGYFKNSLILGSVRLLVRAIYYFSDTILVQSRRFIPAVASLSNEKKVIYYPNSVLDSLALDPSAYPLPTDFLDLMSTNFCIVFAGNIGTAQALDIITQAAERLKKHKKIKIVLIGSGSRASWVKEEIENKNLTNLVLAGRYEAKAMPFIYSKAAGLLVSLNNSEIFSYTIPSKIQSYLAAGKPIIASLDGEGAKVITDSGAGFVSPAGNADLLIKNIEQLYSLSPHEREKMGALGRAYFLKHFEMENQSQRLIEILKKRIEGEVA
ncbi:glycosyltransferase family 4 protein [Legionella sp. km772]|uniref:glycosyltransferase family 4 protein n=1 Tax=Legionella sp. km772 TaxID=2498111 RepID=UPI000F8CD84E|nr:glycosyltransferase family 4 protein [Legionella sp. km772]RUR12747.1 glycosyltransferase WbuB [Legionella sp. km772]